MRQVQRPILGHSFEPLMSIGKANAGLVSLHNLHLVRMTSSYRFTGKQELFRADRMAIVHRFGVHLEFIATVKENIC
jgi:hypothetical protein